MNYKNYKTDKERASIAHRVPNQHYYVLMDWAEQATDPDSKSTLEHYAWDAFHLETM